MKSLGIYNIGGKTFIGTDEAQRTDAYIYDFNDKFNYQRVVALSKDNPFAHYPFETPIAKRVGTLRIK